MIASLPQVAGPADVIWTGAEDGTFWTMGLQHRRLCQRYHCKDFDGTSVDGRDASWPARKR